MAGSGSVQGSKKWSWESWEGSKVQGKRAAKIEKGKVGASGGSCAQEMGDQKSSVLRKVGSGCWEKQEWGSRGSLGQGKGGL